MYNKKLDIHKWGKIAAFCFVGYQVLRFLTHASAAVKIKANEILVSQETGIVGVELDKTNMVATNVYDAIYNYNYGMLEDEATVIEQLNSLTTGNQARAVSIAYYNMPKHSSLKNDINKYLTSSDIKKINTLIRSSIQ